MTTALTAIFTSAFGTAFTTPSTAPRILTPLQGLFRWLTAGALPSRSAAQPGAAYQSYGGGFRQDRDTQLNAAKSNAAKPVTAKSAATNSIANYSTMTRARGKDSMRTPVLRIMRVLEAGQAPASVGRMVISGRMADVCAELDRLAARETARH
jgi:hypothetical protein